MRRTQIFATHRRPSPEQSTRRLWIWKGQFSEFWTIFKINSRLTMTIRALRLSFSLHRVTCVKLWTIFKVWLRFAIYFQLSSATHSGLGVVNAENVFKVCDEPHPLLLTSMLDHCIKREVDDAVAIVMKLYKLGYASEDIIQNIFR